MALLNQRLRCAVCCGMLLIFGSEVVAQDTAEIAKAWKLRERRTRTLRLKWDLSLVIGAGTQPYTDRKGVWYSFPPKNVTVKREELLEISAGQKLRYEYTGPQRVQNSFVNRTYISTSNGLESKVLFSGSKERTSGSFHGQGFVMGAGASVDHDSLQLMPVMLMFRPISPLGSVYDPEQYERLDKYETVRGHLCAILQRIQGEIETKIWVDMKRAYLPMRITHNPKGKQGVDIEMDYAKRSGRWVPVSWECVGYATNHPARGTVIHHGKAKVTECTFNSSIPDGRFNLEFPVNTAIRNHATDETYVLKVGGQKLMITAVEYANGPVDEDLLSSGTGTAATGAGGSVLPETYWLFGVFAAVAVLCLSWYRWKKMVEREVH